MRFTAPKNIEVRLISLILILLFSSKAFPQSWIEYNVSTGNQITIPYITVSTGNSANTNGNQGILLPDFSSDTGRTFLPLDLINDPNAYPWRMAVKMGDVSGVLIDPYHVLTAGHVIDFTPSFIYNLITPSYNSGNSPYGYARAEKLYLLSNFAQGTATDIGIIKLDRPLGALVGWCGVGYNNTDNYFTNNNFINPSYPNAGIFDGQQLYNWKGKFDATYPDFIYSFRQGVVGMSGSPVYTKLNGNYVTFGVLISSGIKFNRINASKFDAINKIIDGNTPDEFDMIPMSTNIFPKIIKSGNQPDSINFGILNYSKENKINANITANIYLSQDSVITTSDSLLGSYYITQNFPAKSSAVIKINSNLPFINMAAGTYWIGIIISGDNNSINNTTRGCDVAKVIVNNSDNIKISGIINSSQSYNGISGVVMSGFPTTVITDYTGYYETEVPSGWSGSITPSKEGYTINPSSKNYSNVTVSIADNYLISKNTFTISGTVKSPILQNGIKNVKITGLAGEPLTDSSGYYSATIYQGWSGYVTIQKSGWYITNPSIIYNHINTNVTEQIIAGFLVKGIIYNSMGNPIKNAALNGFPEGAIYSDSIGSYSKLLDSGWSGTVIPSFSGSTFNPNFRTYNNLSTSYYYHDYNEIPVMKVNLKVFLSGAYASGTDTMSCNIRRNSMLPQIPNINYSNKGNLFYYNLKSSDTVSQLFWNQNKKIVDWISIEILNTNNFSSVDTVLGLLRNDGRVLNLNGDTLIRLDARVTSGNYYIVIRHRNHIAVMNKLPIYISANTPLYDFTTGLDKYYGEDAKQLKPGLFGMYAGDANYDGIINEADFILYNNDSQNALSGYMICDFNIDGYVTSKDFNFIAPNMRKNISTNIPTITYSPK